MWRFLLAMACSVACCTSTALAQTFGKNKVQYKDFEWRVLETPHFEILFYTHDGTLVHDAARMAEAAYEQLASLLHHSFTTRIPLILYASHADFQQTHITPSMIDVGTGGITELVRRRVFLPFTGSYAELRHVLTHELVHAFELDILSEGQRGGPATFGYLPPLWVMEGLAEYLSRDKVDRHNDMWMRDAAVSGYLLGVDDLTFVNDIRAYRFGQSLFRFFAEQQGGERLGDLLRALATHHDLDAAFEEVTGMPLDAFSERWMLDVRRRHLPEIATHRTLAETGRPLLTRHDEPASMLLVPSISPDGDRIAYVSDAGLTRDLRLRNLDPLSEHQRLVRGEMSADFESLRFFSAATAWSPDGRTLAFAAKAGGEDALYLLEVESRRVLDKLTFGLDEVQTPSFSPDGEELVFVGIRNGRSDLYRARSDGSQLTRLTHDRYAVRDPQWSPDGGTIVYVSDEGPGTDFDRLEFEPLHLMLLDLQTGERRDITPFANAKAVSPAWSGDGTWIAFISDQDGISNIYVLNLPTGEVFRLTDVITGISGILPSSPALSWSRESNRLVFSGFVGGGWDMYVINEPQAKLRPLGLDPGEVLALHVPAAGAPGPLGAIGERTDAGVAALAATPGPEGRTAVYSAPRAQASTFVERRYRVRLSPDLTDVGGVVGYDAGVGGQSVLHFADLLGNHTVTVGLGIYGSIRDSDLLLAYGNRSGRISHAWSIFQHRRRYGFRVARTAGDTREFEVEQQTYRGVRVALSRPFDKFTRLEASLQAAGAGGRFYVGDTVDADAPDLSRVRYFAGPGVAYVVDTALYGTTGPVLGRRLRLEAESGFGSLQFTTLQADIRQYWSFGRRYAVAARLFGATSLGRTPQSFYLGGSHSLRGYSYGDLVGYHAALASLEFRFPLLRHMALGWPLPLEFGNVRGALFADAASAWDDEPLRTRRALAQGAVGIGPQCSLGVGTRANLGGVIFRVDWAARFDADVGRLPNGTSVSLGADF